ncbi:MAG: hypothetical protein QOG54_2657 [Actinomycetota bacterium]|jgi:hypothetical protein|nr:hypothetical protein [Actinomycetota bacterium]
MKNAIGDELSPAQAELVGCYDKLASLLGDRSGELAPFEQRNALKALAALWQVANGLDMDRGQIYHLGA